MIHAPHEYAFGRPSSSSILIVVDNRSSLSASSVDDNEETVSAAGTSSGDGSSAHCPQTQCSACSGAAGTGFSAGLEGGEGVVCVVREV